jgi:hypothetical protein
MVSVGEDVAMGVHDSVLGSLLWYEIECSCQCRISGVSYTCSLSPVQRNLLIVGERFVVDARL